MGIKHLAGIYPTPHRLLHLQRRQWRRGFLWLVSDVSHKTTAPFFVAKDIFEGLLEVNDITFTFTKLDGTVRTLRATRNPDRIQAVLGESRSWSPNGTAQGPSHLLRVWDVDAKDFRSIRLSSIIDYVVHIDTGPETVQELWARIARLAGGQQNPFDAEPTP